MLRSAAELKKRQVHTGLALFLCLLVSGCSRSEPTAEGVSQELHSKVASDCLADAATLEKRRVSSVVDGDTLRLSGGDSLRLIGVNTPEIGRDGRRDEPLAQQARRALSTLVGPDDVVWLQAAEDDRDRHGRLLAYAFDRQGRSLSGQLLSQGLGFHVAISPNVGRADCLHAKEAAARAAGRGVWAEPVFGPKSLAELTPGQTGFALVRDRVTRVSFKDNGWWIQLGGKLGLKIAEPDQKRFSRRELQALEGLEVETRGWLVPMNGGWWMMKLGHPSILRRSDSSG